MVRDVDIGILVPVPDSAGAAYYILRDWYADIEDLPAVGLIGNRGQVEGRIHFAVVIDSSDELLFYLFDFILPDADDFAIVLHSEEDMPALSVGKGAYGFIDILCDVRMGFFEFNGDVLAAINQALQFFWDTHS